MVGATAVASLLTGAPPAQAEHCGGTYAQIQGDDPKEFTDPNRPDATFISIQGQHVTFDPDGILPWVDASVDYYSGAPGWALCETGAGQHAACAFVAADKAGEIADSLQPEQLYFRYVYQDSEGTWHVAGEQAVADGEDVANCFLS